MPYLLAAVLSLNGVRLNSFMTIVIGLLAGLGFSIVPFFLIPLCFVELLFIIQRKKLFAWVRLESITILLVMLLYLASIFICHPEYWHTILPLVMRYYFSGMSQPLFELLLLPLTLFCLCVLFIGFIFNCFDHYRTFSSVMLLALTGMLLAFLIPCTSWFYHLIPALSISVLLIAYFIVEAMCYSSSFKQQCIVSLTSAFFLSFPLVYSFSFLSSNE